MKLQHLLSLAFPFFVFFGRLCSAKKTTNPTAIPKNAVLLSTIQSLTLRSGKQTSSRRTSPVPQLQCVGPSNTCSLYAIDLMRCTNEGSDYDASNIQWSCKASLPDEFKLGSTDVSCEGYESAEDEYVLKGSCGVEYRLMLTEKGEEKYGRQKVRDGWDGAGGKGGVAEKWAGYAFMAVFCAVLFIIARAMVQAWRSDGGLRGGGRRVGYGGGGGGGGGDDNDPPPPYDYGAPPRKPKAQTSTRSSSTRSTAAGNNQQDWQPGFWTGALAGAAGGYLAGQRGNNTQTQRPEVQERPGTGSWFGGGNRNAGPSSSYRSGNGAGSSTSGPSYSSSRHESTGFGGTSRR